jgi:hypothetical protein
MDFDCIGDNDIFVVFVVPAWCEEDKFGETTKTF